jgi:hypothetical protein
VNDYDGLFSWVQITPGRVHGRQVQNFYNE